MLWLCLHFPNLSLETFTTTQPGDREPRVVLQNGRVWQANAAAIRLGIDTGMSSATAWAMVDQLVATERVPEKEAVTLEQLAHRLYDYTPSVCIKPPCDLVLEIGSVLRLSGGLQPLLDAIQADLAGRGHRALVGIAHTPGAARLMARSYPGQHRHYFDQAEQRLDKPALKQLLATAPLAHLECSPRQREQLQQLGLLRLGDLFELPMKAVGRRLGKEFLRYLAQVRGEIADPQQYLQPPEHFHRSLFFTDGIRDVEGLLFPMRRLLGELGDFLRHRQLQCLQFHWQLAGDRHARELPVHLSRPGHDAAVFLELTRESLANLALGGSVETLSLRCEQVVPLEQKPASLFALDDAPRRERAAGLVDRISARLGRNKVHVLKPRAAHLPERAWQREAPAPARKTEQMALDFNPSRPPWLLRQPVRLNMRGGQLYWQGKLTLLQGPERIESHWHDTASPEPAPAKRDYFVARHENGCTYWVFHDQVKDSWFAQGVFA